MAGWVKVSLEIFEPTPLRIHAVYPNRQFLPTKVSAFVAYLTEEFRLSPWISDYGYSADSR